MKQLLKTNCYDIEDTIIIMGSCMPNMQPKAYEELNKKCNNIYEVCLEETHLNIVITKIIGMLSRVKVNKLIFATVDKSPHCVQLHYVVKELEKVIDLSKIQIENYVAKDNKLIEIPIDVISISKDLSKLKQTLKK